MKDFLSNEHYCYKTHTLLMRTNASSLSFNSQPPYIEYPAPPPSPILQGNLDPLFYDFSKI